MDGGPDRRAMVVSGLVGVGHAAAIAALVDWLDYPIDSLGFAPGGTVGALLGLTVLLVIPTYVALRYRLALPLLAAVVGAGWPVYRELTTPRPEFSTLGGHQIVHGTRYVDAYLDAWYVWLFSYLLLGLVEYVARLDHDWLPAPAGSEALAGRDGPPMRRVVLVVAVGHAAVLLGLAVDAGYFAPGGFLPSPWFVGLALLAWTVVGLLVIGALPPVLLVRWRLLAPTAALAWLVREVGWTQQLALPDDPLPVYFIGWFFFAGALAGLGGLEYAARRAWRWGRDRGQ